MQGVTENVSSLTADDADKNPDFYPSYPRSDFGLASAIEEDGEVVAHVGLVEEGVFSRK